MNDDARDAMNDRWEWPDTFTGRDIANRGSWIREADDTDLQRLGLRPGHRVQVGWK